MKACSPVATVKSGSGSVGGGPDPSAILIAFVRNALQAKMKGNTMAYNKILDSLTAKIDDAARVRWYSTLGQCVSLISPSSHHSQLIQTVLAFDWADSSPALVDVYCRFLIDLACSSGKFLPSCFAALVTKLRCHDQSNECALGDIIVAHHAASDAIATQIHDAVHGALQSILRLVPSSSTVLFPLLVSSFPHTRLPASHHLAYIRNILRITDYAPQLRDRILDLIVQKVILLDCETTDQDQGVTVAATTDLADIDDLMFDVDSDMVATPLPDVVPDQTVIELSPAEDKLDRVMALLVGYLKMLGDSRRELCAPVFTSMLRSFESIVLTTHNCRHTQFFLFYICSFQNWFTEAFLRALLERAFDLTQPSQLRTNCALYIASFVSRANFMRHSTRIHCFELLLKYLHAYTDIHEDANREHQSRDSADEHDGHTVFYAIAQTTFHIFCQFQHEFEALLDESPDLGDFFRFPHIVESSLNPLRFCLDDVVAEFATVVLSLRLGDVYPVIRRNNMLSVIPAANTHFPFAPLRLTRTRAFFEDIFDNRTPGERRQCDLNLDDDLAVVISI